MTASAPSIRLEAGQLHALPDIAGLELRCVEGTLWLTLDHDPRDIVLEPGQTFVGTGHHRALVFAFRPARMQVRALPQQEAARAPRRWFARAA